VGCHGGNLIGVDAAHYLKSAEHIVAGAQKAVELYRPDGLPVLFDLQVEAECLGCTLEWSDQNPPAVVSHPLAGGAGSVEELNIPGPGDGRIPIAIEAAGRLREGFPDLALYGLVTGPFTLGLHLLGTDIFMDMCMDPDKVHAVLDFCTRTSQAMADYYLDAGCDVIAMVDPMTSQIGPDQFTEFVSPGASRLFEHIRGKRGLSSFFVCGQAQQNIQVMCDCKPDNVSIDENIPLDYVRDVCLPRNVSFGGNLKLTVVLLLGSPDDVRRDTMQCLDIGGEKGFLLAPGCDLPYATPVENLGAVADLVHDPYQREVARTISDKKKVERLPDMSDYGSSDKVVIDVITLDSESCAPCQYMVESVASIAPQFEGIVEWREHKIKNPEGVAFMTALMVKNIPTICIDGRISFVSRIPPREELAAAIQKRILEKLKFRIRQKNAEIRILGSDREKADRMEKRLRDSATLLGISPEFIRVDDPDEIASYGVAATPAVVITQHRVKAQGRVPSGEVVREWLKELA
jgi:uroporphyrinogen decarboxylase